MENTYKSVNIVLKTVHTISNGNGFFARANQNQNKSVWRC